jgi:hypothetical protein
MIRLLVPSKSEVRWAFYVVAICAFALTGVIVWGVVHKINQSDGVLHVAVANADQVQRQGEQLDAQGRQLDALKAQAAVDARKAARVAASLRRQNRRLLEFLQDNGISVPPAIVGPSGGGSSPPKGRGPQGPQLVHPPLLPVPLVTPAPTPSPTPSPSLADQVCALLNIALCPL